MSAGNDDEVNGALVIDETENFEDSGVDLVDSARSSSSSPSSSSTSPSSPASPSTSKLVSRDPKGAPMLFMSTDVNAITKWKCDMKVFVFKCNALMTTKGNDKNESQEQSVMVQPHFADCPYGDQLGKELDELARDKAKQLHGNRSEPETSTSDQSESPVEQPMPQGTRRQLELREQDYVLKCNPPRPPSSTDEPCSNSNQDNGQNGNDQQHQQPEPSSITKSVIVAQPNEFANMPSDSARPCETTMLVAKHSIPAALTVASRQQQSKIAAGLNQDSASTPLASSTTPLTVASSQQSNTARGLNHESVSTSASQPLTVSSQQSQVATGLNQDSASTPLASSTTPLTVASSQQSQVATGLNQDSVPRSASSNTVGSSTLLLLSKTLQPSTLQQQQQVNKSKEEAKLNNQTTMQLCPNTETELIYDPKGAPMILVSRDPNGFKHWRCSVDMHGKKCLGAFTTDSNTTVIAASRVEHEAICPYGTVRAEEYYKLPVKKEMQTVKKRQRIATKSQAPKPIVTNATVATPVPLPTFSTSILAVNKSKPTILHQQSSSNSSNTAAGQSILLQNTTKPIVAVPLSKTTIVTSSAKPTIPPQSIATFQQPSSPSSSNTVAAGQPVLLQNVTKPAITLPITSTLSVNPTPTISLSQPVASVQQPDPTSQVVLNVKESPVALSLLNACGTTILPTPVATVKQPSSSSSNNTAAGQSVLQNATTSTVAVIISPTLVVNNSTKLTFANLHNEPTAVTSVSQPKMPSTMPATVSTVNSKPNTLRKPYKTGKRRIITHRIIKMEPVGGVGHMQTIVQQGTEAKTISTQTQAPGAVPSTSATTQPTVEHQLGNIARQNTQVLQSRPPLLVHQSSVALPVQSTLAQANPSCNVASLNTATRSSIPVQIYNSTTRQLVSVATLNSQPLQLRPQSSILTGQSKQPTVPQPQTVTIRSSQPNPNRAEYVILQQQSSSPSLSTVTIPLNNNNEGNAEPVVSSNNQEAILRAALTTPSQATVPVPLTRTASVQLQTTAPLSESNTNNIQQSTVMQPGSNKYSVITKPSPTSSAVTIVQQQAEANPSAKLMPVAQLARNPSLAENPDLSAMNIGQTVLFPNQPAGEVIFRPVAFAKAPQVQTIPIAIKNRSSSSSSPSSTLHNVQSAIQSSSSTTTTTTTTAKPEITKARIYTSQQATQYVQKIQLFEQQKPQEQEIVGNHNQNLQLQQPKEQQELGANHNQNLQLLATASTSSQPLIAPRRTLTSAPTPSEPQVDTTASSSQSNKRFKPNSIARAEATKQELAVQINGEKQSECRAAVQTVSMMPCAAMSIPPSAPVSEAQPSDQIAASHLMMLSNHGRHHPYPHTVHNVQQAPIARDGDGAKIVAAVPVGGSGSVPLPLRAAMGSGAAVLAVQQGDSPRAEKQHTMVHRGGPLALATGTTTTMNMSSGDVTKSTAKHNHKSNQYRQQSSNTKRANSSLMPQQQRPRRRQPKRATTLYAEKTTDENGVTLLFEGMARVDKETVAKEGDEEESIRILNLLRQRMFNNNIGDNNTNNAAISVMHCQQGEETIYQVQEEKRPDEVVDNGDDDDTVIGDNEEAVEERETVGQILDDEERRRAEQRAKRELERICKQQRAEQLERRRLEEQVKQHDDEWVDGRFKNFVASFDDIEEAMEYLRVTNFPRELGEFRFYDRTRKVFGCGRAATCQAKLWMVLVDGQFILCSFDTVHSDHPDQPKWPKLDGYSKKTTTMTTTDKKQSDTTNKADQTKLEDDGGGDDDQMEEEEEKKKWFAELLVAFQKYKRQRCPKLLDHSKRQSLGLQYQLYQYDVLRMNKRNIYWICCMAPKCMALLITDRKFKKPRHNPNDHTCADEIFP